jgi:hypothetical protein
MMKYVNGELVELTADEIAQHETHQAARAADQTPEWQQLRSQRDQLIAATDYLLLSDVWATLSADKQATLMAYRQALRDLPINTVDPKNPTWPTWSLK